MAAGAGGGKNYISAKGYQRLVDEIHQLQNVERPKVTEIVAWAASLGDRSENADYQYGKKRLREIDSRLRFLHTRVNSAEVVDYLKNSGPVVRFGATVELESEDGESKRLTIVGVDEIEVGGGRISWRSPWGASLLGKSEGDEVVVDGPTGKKSWALILVEYVPW